MENQCNLSIIRHLGITGSTIRIDQFGDSEGNFSVLALKDNSFSAKDTNFSCERHMVVVATFQQNKNVSNLPVSKR
jgi:guanylate cyclase, other